MWSRCRCYIPGASGGGEEGCKRGGRGRPHREGYSQPRRADWIVSGRGSKAIGTNGWIEVGGLGSWMAGRRPAGRSLVCCCSPPPVQRGASPPRTKPRAVRRPSASQHTRHGAEARSQELSWTLGNAGIHGAGWVCRPGSSAPASSGASRWRPGSYQHGPRASRVHVLARLMPATGLAH